MKANSPVHAFRTQEKLVSRLACFPIILLLALSRLFKTCFEQLATLHRRARRMPLPALPPATRATGNW